MFSSLYGEKKSAVLVFHFISVELSWLNTLGMYFLLRQKSHVEVTVFGLTLFTLPVFVKQEIMLFLSA